VLIFNTNNKDVRKYTRWVDQALFWHFS